MGGEKSPGENTEKGLFSAARAPGVSKKRFRSIFCCFARCPKSSTVGEKGQSTAQCFLGPLSIPTRLENVGLLAIKRK